MTKAAAVTRGTTTMTAAKTTATATMNDLAVSSCLGKPLVLSIVVDTKDDVWENE